MDALLLDGWTPLILLALISMAIILVLSRKLARRVFYSIAVGIALLCIAVFFGSMVVIGGWEGMGYGILAVCVLVGTLIGTALGSLSTGK
ncbi:hypothetical protein NCCP2716_26070 [Sporosarcina sp. NCCP-2716]|uniref:YesK-like family protein n=1 Tax=Sporosarcina sp. NCCP-2716 TaxID=2943679 RepID=UPI00203BED02|nr:YesK-like family protein [Sporosarcina sp. NCCP-2716]GKV70109.1 hypothetical protein NCCP2716_26070 [Sporosarcina sp. NCCP-2716]